MDEWFSSFIRSVRFVWLKEFYILFRILSLMNDVIGRIKINKEFVEFVRFQRTHAHSVYRLDKKNLINPELNWTMTTTMAMKFLWMNEWNSEILFNQFFLLLNERKYRLIKHDMFDVQFIENWISCKLLKMTMMIKIWKHTLLLLLIRRHPKWCFFFHHENDDKNKKQKQKFNYEAAEIGSSSLASFDNIFIF